MSVFFTSDQHFGDERLKLFGRPFSTSRECLEKIVENHNAIVKETDTVFHLGDFAIKPEYIDVAVRLNGKKHLIRGNYDREIDKVYMKYFQFIGDSYEWEITDPHIDDPFGFTGLTTEQMRARDKFVFESLKEKGIPCLFVMAGGYQEPIETKLAPLHVATFEEAYATRN